MDAEDAHKADNKGQAHMMFLHRDNHMQNKRVHTKWDFENTSKCTRVKNKSKGLTPCRSHPKG